MTKRAERSLRAFIEGAWPVLEPQTRFVPNWHIDLIAEYLEAVTAGEIRHLLINVPPRSMKSLLVSVFWPAWEWLRRPGGRWIFTSYAEGLASKHSLDRRTLIQSPWYQERWGCRIQLASDQNVKGEFQNTRRGVMLATSIGGSVTGKGGSRIIVDDPHNPIQAESDVQREHAVTYFRNTLSTRLDDKKADAIVVVMQRLHERDLAATCMDLGYSHINLPAEAEAPTTFVMPRSGRSVTRAVGDLLWPEREGRAELDMQKALLGSAAYAGQYQQRPAPAAGLFFQRGWWRYYTDVPAAFDEVVQSWDLSFKEGAGNDFVVGLVAGRVGALVYLLDRYKEKASFVETCHAIERMCERHPSARRVLIEDAANGPAVVDTLRRRLSGVIAVRPEGGKQSRAAAVQPLVESGQIYLPEPRRKDGVRRAGRDWVDDFVETCSVFPKGAHDDDVDALSQLVVYWQQQRSYRQPGDIGMS